MHRHNAKVNTRRFLRKGAMESRLMVLSEESYEKWIPGFAVQGNV